MYICCKCMYICCMCVNPRMHFCHVNTWGKIKKSILHRERYVCMCMHIYVYTGIHIQPYIGGRDVQRGHDVRERRRNRYVYRYDRYDVQRGHDVRDRRRLMCTNSMHANWDVQVCVCGVLGVSIHVCACVCVCVCVCVRWVCVCVCVVCVYKNI